MPLQLAYANEQGVITEHLMFEGTSYKLGRSSQADIVIRHPQISRIHATIKTDADNDVSNWTIDDTSSTGCFVGGRAVKHETLPDNTLMFLGPVPCQLKRLSMSDLAQQDSVYFWRKQQLRQFEKTIYQSHDTSSMLDVARHSMTQTLGCERAALLLFDEQQDIGSAIGHEDWMDTQQFSGSRTVIKHAIETRQPVAVGDLQADHQFSAQQSVIRYGLKAALCVPVIAEDRVIGVLYGDNTQGRQYFTHTDVKLTQLLANMLSLRLLFHSIEHNISLVTEI